MDKYDTDDDKKLNAKELADVKEIDCKKQGIKDLTGIEYFGSLKTLYCNNNELTTLDVSKNAELVELYCGSNKLTSLNINGLKNLELLKCSNNALSSLDVSEKKKLSGLYCDNNALTSLDVHNNKVLTHMHCQNNKLETLDVSQNTALTELNCSNNALTSLDLSNNTDLRDLQCEDNIYNISIVDWKYDLSKLPAGFEVSQVVSDSWNGGTVENGILTLDGDALKVTYTYNCGRNKTAVFTLALLVDINKANFPDDNFRKFVSDNYDTDKDGKLSSAELEAVTAMNCSNKGIEDLTGIGYFTSLVSLYCNNNDLSKLDLSKNTELTYLECKRNNLTKLDLSENTELAYLECERNNLTKLDLSKNTKLIGLYCEKNELASLNLSKNDKLELLNCEDNKLETLDISKNPKLSYLDCQNNALTSLDVSSNKKLEYLVCSNNALTKLDVSGNADLEILVCDSNKLEVLDVSNNKALAGLSCSANALTSIDISSNKGLESKYFFCKDNVYKITAVNGKFDLKNLPGNFDASRASNWNGAVVKDGKLIIASNVDKVTYTYDCGNGASAEFTLLVTHTTKSDAPKTGDNDNNLILWIAMLLACSAVTGAGLSRRRKCGR